MSKKRKQKRLPLTPSAWTLKRMNDLAGREMYGADAWGTHRCSQCGSQHGVTIAYKAGDEWDLCFACFSLVANTN